jgi:hypothetical protein
MRLLYLSATNTKRFLINYEIAYQEFCTRPGYAFSYEF